MTDPPLHPETPREIALCRMACDEMIECVRYVVPVTGEWLVVNIKNRRDARFPAPPKTRVPRVLTLDDGSEWTFDGRWWRWSRYPTVHELASPYPWWSCPAVTTLSPEPPMPDNRLHSPVTSP